MSDRHMHITSYLYDTDPDRLAAFAAEALKHFGLVVPVVRRAERQYVTGGDQCPLCGRLLAWDEEGAGRKPVIRHRDPQCGWQPDGIPSSRKVLAFALYSKDGGGFDDLIYTLPRAAGALSGILCHDIEIVSAWESASEGAQRVWPIPGRR